MADSKKTTWDFQLVPQFSKKKIPWKSVNIYDVAKMGWNFAVYPGLQQKSKCV